MQRSLENEIQCSRLEGDINNARSNIVSFTQHIGRLEQNIQIQEGLLSSLQSQMDRTGDSSFASDIQQAMDEIEHLRQQIANARDTISEWEDALRDSISEYRSSGCDGSIGI